MYNNNHPQQNFNQVSFNKGNAIPNDFQNNPDPKDLQMQKGGSDPFIEVDIKNNNQQAMPPQNKTGPSLKDTFIEFNKVFGQIQPKFEKMYYYVNVIYYNEPLTEEQKISDNQICSNFRININGTFYGINTFNLFEYVCQKIKNTPKNFILISSGFCAEKLYNYCAQMNMNNIYPYYIFCSHIERYLHLKQRYPRLENIFNSFDDLISNTLSNQNKINLLQKSPNLIFLSDYNQTYVSWHFDLARRFAIYKSLKSNKSFEQSKYFELVKNKRSYYKDLANDLVIFEEEYLIGVFQALSEENELELRKVFKLNKDIKNFVSNYTAENFYYKYINKFIKENDFLSFRYLSNQMCRFIYYLYESKKNNYQLSIETFYKKVYITEEDLNIYSYSVGNVICEPWFSSISLDKNVPPRLAYISNSILATIVIQQNHCPSIVNVTNLSNHPNEDEYLCLPFTFFKITNVENNMGNIFIYLTALNSKKNIEEMYLDFMKNNTDNLDPDGLDILKISNNGISLEINEELIKVINDHSNDIIKKY